MTWALKDRSDVNRIFWEWRPEENKSVGIQKSPLLPPTYIKPELARTPLTKPEFGSRKCPMHLGTWGTSGCCLPPHFSHSLPEFPWPWAQEAIAVARAPSSGGIR